MDHSTSLSSAQKVKLSPDGSKAIECYFLAALGHLQKFGLVIA